MSSGNSWALNVRVASITFLILLADTFPEFDSFEEWNPDEEIAVRAGSYLQYNHVLRYLFSIYRRQLESFTVTSTTSSFTCVIHLMHT